MAGYYGCSMSNNAVDAYSDGEKPKSKWTKASIMAEIRFIVEDEEIAALDIDVVAKLTKDELMDTFLVQSSWHHTSKHFNKTNFYRVQVDDIDTDKILSMIANRPPRGQKLAPVVAPITYAEVEYIIWTGTYKHAKPTKLTGQAVVQGNWVYILGGPKKKKSGAYVLILKTYTRKPKSFDTDAVKRIKATMK